MTQQELAEWLSVDRTTVVRLEAGEVQALKRLMDALSLLRADLVIVDRFAELTVTESARGDTVGDRRERDARD